MMLLDRDIADFMPHRGTMLLVERLVEHDGDTATAEVTVTPRSNFFQPGRGVPAYVGIEYMAQAVAAYDGASRLLEGKLPATGFLLGTRQFEATRPYFRDQDHLVIKIRMIYRDQALGSFDCVIEVDGVVCCKAMLNVYRPGDGTDGMAPNNDNEGNG